jgi:hypothetical protein
LRPRCIRGDANMDLKEIRREYVNWFSLTQDRDQWRALVNMVGLNDDHRHVNEVRQSLWTATNNGPIVHPPDYI